MSALPLPITPPPATTGPQWISIEEAARRSGWVVGYIRRLCADAARCGADGSWEQRKLAEVRPHPRGRGKGCWWIREDAHPKLARVKFPEQLSDEFDLNKFHDWQQVHILKCEKVIKRWELLTEGVDRGAKEEITQRFIDELSTEGTVITRATLYNWYDAYRSRGRAGLVDKRWKVAKEKSDDATPVPFADFFNELETWYLDQNEPSARTCYKLAVAVARKKGQDVPSYRHACRYLAGLKRSKKVYARLGGKAFDDKCAAYLPRDYTRIIVNGVERPMQSNDIWVGDHHVCDTIVRHNGKLVRPWLTAWEDIRSRRIVGYRFAPHPPDSSSVLLAFRSGVMSNGMAVPRCAYVDNGKDFDCYTFQGQTKAERKRERVEVRHDPDLFDGVFGLLKVEIIHAQPFNAKAKPVEPFFGTYEEQFGKLTHTYCGRSPEHKPPQLAERLKGKNVPTYEDYVADATAWIERIYHAQAHTGHGMDGRTPDAIYAENLIEIRTTTVESLDACMRVTSKPVTVGRNGVKFKDRVYGQGEPWTHQYQGQKVHVCVDPEEITRAVIRSAEGGAVIAVATALELMPFGAMTEQRYKDAQVKVRRHNRSMKEVQKRGMRMTVSPLEILLEEQQQAQRAAEKTTPPPAPASIQMINTGIQDRSKDVRTGFKMPVAAGGESIDLLAAADALELTHPTPAGSMTFDLMSSLEGE